MNCNHQKTQRQWVDVDQFGEETQGKWKYETVFTTEDIDTHRYLCTQCGKIMYYSGAAREYFETGVDHKGLFQK